MKNFASLLALRVLLGMFESVSAPSLILIVSMWYKKNGAYYLDSITCLILRSNIIEQPSRMGWWYQGVALGPFISGLASYGLLFYSGTKFYSWQVSLTTMTYGS